MPQSDSPPARSVRTWRSLAISLAALGLAACGNLVPNAPSEFSYRMPDAALIASATAPKTGWSTRSYAVAAANPLATDAGQQVLQAGGTAIDAAVAVQMVLTLVEPQSSGIGGGAFILHHDGRRTQAWDGRETAPAAADENLFLQADGTTMPFARAVVGGRSVGVPGAVRALEAAHRQHGRLPWATLFTPAIRLAEAGFPMSPRLHAQLQAETALRQDPEAAALFYRPDGSPHAVGHLLRNPALAQVLRALAQQGSAALHEGEVAQAIVARVRQHPSNPGTMSLADLSGYRPRLREPLCHDYHAQTKDYRICGMPPPSSGALAIGQILGLLQHTPAAQLPPPSKAEGGPNLAPGADWLHLYADAARLAFADRNQYVADPDFVPAPAGDWMSLLNPNYLAQRARQIRPDGPSLGVASPGQPGASNSAYAPMVDQPEFGTSHISIIDRWGNAIAMTTTIEAVFGSRVMVRGFLLNNELTDFSLAPRDASGRPVANRVEPGKRPRSSMSPTLVFERDSGRLVMTVGSPGGAAIIHYTAKTLYGVLNWRLNVQDAIALPNFGSQNGPTQLEASRFPPTTVQALRTRGAPVQEVALPSGLQGIERRANGYFGGADPRREGIVLGD